MNGKHEESSLEQMTRAYKIIALGFFFFTRLHVQVGPGNGNDSLE